MEAEQIVKMLETVLDLKLKPIKDDISDMKQDIRDLSEKFDLLSSEQPSDTLAMLQIINTKLDSIQKDVEFTYLKTSKNELEINRLKTQ
ncbi:hypothetical protein [Paenibacillus zanthoxyli]|uniref:hypothetical protein n=1 Tax=Paenibacillus zanthoxyli TaxID=369399 RepID=UPI0004700BAA|nr:hypothetical protein [Paenibacillus zanthoxyli]